MSTLLQAVQAVKQYRKTGVPLSHCTVASDGFGSWPVYDKQGRLLSYEVSLQLLFHMTMLLGCVDVMLLDLDETH